MPELLRVLIGGYGPSIAQYLTSTNQRVAQTELVPAIPPKIGRNWALTLFSYDVRS